VSELSFTDEILWRVVELLATRPEHINKNLEELVQTATRTIIWAREIAKNEENNYRREAFEKDFESKEIISEGEIARLVTGDSHRERAIKRFREMIGYIMEQQNNLGSLNENLVLLSENLTFLDRYFEGRQWPKGWVDYLRKLLPEWQRIKRAMVQPKTKKKKKVLALP